MWVIMVCGFSFFVDDFYLSWFLWISYFGGIIFCRYHLLWVIIFYGSSFFVGHHFFVFCHFIFCGLSWFVSHHCIIIWIINFSGLSLLVRYHFFISFFSGIMWVILFVGIIFGKSSFVGHHFLWIIIFCWSLFFVGKYMCRIQFFEGLIYCVSSFCWV